VPAEWQLPGAAENGKIIFVTFIEFQSIYKVGQNY
jgi:hypothetical protein